MRDVGIRSVAHAGAVIVALLATVATSPPRWYLQAPAIEAAADTLDARAPSGTQRFRVTVSPALVDHEQSTPVSAHLIGAAHWTGATSSSSSVLHLRLHGLQSADGKSETDIVLRPDETVEVALHGSLDLKHCAAGKPCGLVVGTDHTWEQPDGSVEIRWTVSAEMRGYKSRRDPGPPATATLTITEMP